MLNSSDMAPHQLRRVRPEPVNEKTLVGTVVNFFHDAVIDKVPLQTTNQRSASTQDIKEPIEWIHYEQISFNNKIKYNIRSMVISNILLIIGYKTGFSVWCIDLNGVATEVLSIKETHITHVKLLKLDHAKLLLAVCKYASEQQYSVSIVSLISGDVVHKIDYSGEVLEMKSNSRFLVLSSISSIDAYDMLNNYEHKFKIATCYSNINQTLSPGGTNIINPTNMKPSSNPFALGSRWLVFADSRFHVMFNSVGGMSNEIEQSYTATVLNTAKSISKGLTKITESFVNTVVPKTTTTTSPVMTSSSSPSSATTINESPRVQHKKLHDDFQGGICTVIDTLKYVNNAKESNSLHDENQKWIIAHFIAHQEPIYAFEFNHSGRLLVTADTLGQYFNIYQISPNPYKCTRTQIKHLYSLYRGDTTSKVKDISFSYDSRWLAVSTKRGTTHIFPINSYGGPVNSRTHANPYVVNRASRHSRTAGFADEDTINKISQQQQQQSQGLLIQQAQMNDNHQQTLYAQNNNPKLRNILEPFVIQALGQIRQPYFGSNISAATATAVDNVTHFANSTNLLQLDTLCVVSAFADTRGYLSPEEPRDFTKNRLKPINSLFVISNLNGNLIEYVLEVCVDIAKTGNKRTNDSPILLKVTPKAQWPLQRSITSNEAKYQLVNENPLLDMYKSIHNLPTSDQTTANSGSGSSSSSANNSPVLSNLTNSYNGSSVKEDKEWIKHVEINTHLGPHRRLFMGPQFVFKTINTNITTTALNAASSAIASTETPLIDLCGELELNSLDLTRNYSTSPMSMPNYISQHININNSNSHSCTPTFIEVGPGSYQDEMPIFKVYGSSNESISDGTENSNNIIESIADAMNDVQINNNSPNNMQLCGSGPSSYNGKITAAIAIASSNGNSNIGSNSRRTHSISSAHSSIPSALHSNSVTSYKQFVMNQPNFYHHAAPVPSNGGLFLANEINFRSNTNSLLSNNNGNENNNNNSSHHTSIGQQLLLKHNHHQLSTNLLLDDADSNSSSTHSSLTSRANAPSLENMQFQDEN